MPVKDTDQLYDIPLSQGVPAVATFKAREVFPNLEEGTRVVQSIIRDKGYLKSALTFLRHHSDLSRLMSNLLLRNKGNTQRFILYDYYLTSDDSLGNDTYHGTPQENEIIDAAIAQNKGSEDLRREQSGIGATRIFELETGGAKDRLPLELRNTPVLILGGGAAGILQAAALIALGVNPKAITIVEKSGEKEGGSHNYNLRTSLGGIWRQKNTRRAKNNPFELDMLGIFLNSAAGDGSQDGEEVSRFLTRVEVSALRRTPTITPQIAHGVVESVVPDPNGRKHKVYLKGVEKPLIAPIVYNCLGIGEPLPVNRPGKMTTNTPQEAGIRWQQEITPEQAEKMRDASSQNPSKELVMIGLGNSTAEMLVQIEKYNDQEIAAASEEGRVPRLIKYKILTDYPFESIQFPNRSVHSFDAAGRERVYRLARDIRRPNLTKLAYDLPSISRVYGLARLKGAIISDVVHWDKGKDRITVYTKSGPQIFDVYQLYSLIGYSHPAKSLQKMGMLVEDRNGVPVIAAHYDGEIVRDRNATGREAVYPGYFAAGAILKDHEYNPNAEVIPGIMTRLYDSLFTTAVRMAENYIAEREESRRRISRTTGIH